MRRLVLLIVIGFIAAPGALAQEVTEPTFRSLGELRRAVEQEIEVLTDDDRVPMAPGDWESYRQYRLARVDFLIGSIRSEAHAAHGAEITDPVLSTAIWDLDGASTNNDVARALANATSATLAQERFALDWVSLYAAIDQLRALTAEERPVRACPVAGPASFIDDYAEPRPWGRSHTGIDLDGDFGTPLQAVEAGTVVQANWHWAGGRQIYIRSDATGDVYYYAHLDSWATWIWTGTRVEAGDIIGTMGWSGDADSSHLHFGWMPGSNDVDLDNLQNAYPLLLEICR